MKKTLFLLTALVCAAGLSAKELKVLMIGNSFSRSVTQFLPQVVEAGKKHTLLLCSASIGGCSLQKHCANIDKEQKDPNFKSYVISVTGEKGRKGRMSDMLTYKKWDIVTIQQVSHQSFKKEMTREYAAKLIAYIRKLAPQAEIVIHQTWAYRSDNPMFHKKDKPFTQEQMYNGLVENYNELAKTHKLRIIPMGTAVQLYRKALPVKEVKYTREQIKALKRPNVLEITGGDLVGWMRWRKETDKEPYNDRAHLGKDGTFVQGCVWYMFLFDEDAKGIKLDYKTPNRDLMLKCAEEAVKQYKK
jgi:hypothetical protein